MASAAHRTVVCNPHERLWVFGDCRYDERRRELRVRGKVVELEAKPLEVLHQLLLHAGDLVTKEELLVAVWPNAEVVDGSLTTAVSKLRKRIEHDGQTVVLTVPRVGYRLALPVHVATAEIDGLTAAPLRAIVESAIAPAPVLVRKARRSGFFGIIAAVTVLITIAALLASSGSRNSAAPRTKNVVVLPFENVGGDRSLDHLRLALANEVATILQDSQKLSVRLYAESRKNKDAELDLQKAAREMQGSTIITGHYIRGNGKLHVTMEAVDAENNRVLWEDTITVPAQNLVALQAAIANRARGPLAIALGAAR